MKIFVSSMLSPIGRLIIASSEKGLCKLAFPTETLESVLNWVYRNYKNAETVDGTLAHAAVCEQLKCYFNCELKEFDMPLDLKGTEFQRSVYDRLMVIPYGKVTTYGDVAADINKPKAARAVGQAVGANPVPIIVPCHRVLASSGGLGGFGGGLDIKRALLTIEGIHIK